jgi:hypothetical protein
MYLLCVCVVFDVACALYIFACSLLFVDSLSHVRADSSRQYQFRVLLHALVQVRILLHF